MRSMSRRPASSSIRCRKDWNPASRKAVRTSPVGRSIAQRVSTVQHADQIVVLSDGQVAGIGKHDELMADCEVYREIVESQTKEPAMGEEA